MYFLIKSEDFNLKRIYQVELYSWNGVIYAYIATNRPRSFEMPLY